MRSSISNVFSRKQQNLPAAGEAGDSPKDATTTKKDVSTTFLSDFEVALIKNENELLRKTIRQLEMENERLSHFSSTIVLETFEGEGKSSSGKDVWYKPHENTTDSAPLLTATATNAPADASVSEYDDALWCDELDSQGTCPLEPQVSFRSALKDRAVWLVGLLAFQSCSGFILSHNEALLENHPTIIYFLTMLVGAGGNAGNQASVRVIRGLALGTLNERTQAQFLWRELRMSFALCAILSLAGFIRASVFRTPLPETIAVTTALSLIVFSSICLGAVLPLLLKKLGVDPAHSSTTIQVVMDILGVVLTVAVSGALLDSPVGVLFVSRLVGS